MDQSDAELLVAWRSGDRPSGEVLMRRHYATILRYFELNATWSAEDLVQRTFVACIESADRVRDPSAFRAYLLGIARRQLVMHRRTLARSRVLHSFDDGVPGPPQTRLSTLVARTQEHVSLLRGLASLPSAPQLLLVLYYWQGIPTPVLARHYDVEEVTIRTRMNRARTKLREVVTRMRRGIGHQPLSPERLETLMAEVAASQERPG